MEKREPGVDAEDLLMRQYPSPGADGQEIAFYNANQGDHSLEQPIDPNLDSHMGPQSIEQQAMGQQAMGQQPLEQQGNMEQQGMQQQNMEQQQGDIQQEPPSPRQDVRRASVSAEELQLAAQLTQGLAPMIEAANAHEEHGLPAEEPSLQGAEPGLESLMQVQEANMHDQHGQQGLAGQEHNYHGVMPHPEQQPHQYGEVPQAPAHMQQHLQVAQMAQQAYAVGVDHIPPRKRSKASRACDECRRKKVKCDSVSETGEEQCSNCRRTQMQCLFSRIPQKRGPSKGYIKELAERIHNIEGKLGGQAAAPDGLDMAAGRRDPRDGYSPAVSLNENAKRPFSSMSGDAFITPVTNRHAAWASEPRPIHPYQPAASLQTPFSPSALAPAPQPIVGRAEGPAASRPAAEMEEPPSLPSEAQSGDQPREIDEADYHSYTLIMHQTIPLLPSNKVRMQNLLAQCPRALAEAFLCALHGLVESFEFPLAPASPNSGGSRRASSLLTEWDAHPGRKLPVANLVHLQTLILLAVEADNHGGHASPPKTAFLARAVAVAYSSGLPSAQVPALSNSEDEADLERRLLSLRAWWALICLDRWNAVATGKPLLVPHDAVTMSASLKDVLEEGPYLFAKLSYLLGPLVTNFLTVLRPSLVSPGYGAVISGSVNTAIEFWRADLPATITDVSHPVVLLAYWHIRLMTYLFMPSALATDVLWASRESKKMMLANPGLMSPFNHYINCLTGICLVELAKVDKTREASQLAIAELLEADIPPSSWNTALCNMLADKLHLLQLSAGPDGGSETAASQGLQHLADLAAATTTTTAADAAPTDAASAGGATTISAPPAAASASATDGTAITATTTTTDSQAATEKPAVAAAADKEGPKFRMADNYEDLGFDPRPMLRAGYLSAIAVDHPPLAAS